MAKVSVLIPSRNELFLTNTIEDVLKKAAGEIEVLVYLDEKPPERFVDGVTYLHSDKPRGMRAGINACVKASTGEFLLKADGHCMFAEGFDEILRADMQDNWIVIPRRYSLDAENWHIEENGKSPRDYHYLCYPDPGKAHDQGMHGVEWSRRGRERKHISIDDTPSFQGSCWFMKRTWFDFLGGMKEEGYGSFCQEPQELGNSTWLGGGEVKVNKKTWYAHLHKGKRYGRMYSRSHHEDTYGHNWSALYWMNNQWEKRIHDMGWLIEKFWPMPTWPENYKDEWTEDGRWKRSGEIKLDG